MNFLHYDTFAYDCQMLCSNFFNIELIHKLPTYLEAHVWSHSEYEIIIVWTYLSKDRNIYSIGLYLLNIVDSRYLQLQGTLWNTMRYPYLDISDLQNWGKNNSINHIVQIYM